MDMNLLQDTISMLQQHIDAGTEIELTDMDGAPVQDIANLLNAYELAYSRKMTVLACCMLIHAAITRHKKLAVQDNSNLTRSILDGDYLTGLLYRLAVKRKEWKLLSRLLPFHKRVQLALLKDPSPDRLFRELKHEIDAYLKRSA
ncbi:hypothetical protein ABDI30_21550 [Paenibacillus cisolokensis]|uniref:hypothetical protein n=1 Tax=Paenibacillus cisolokensis TaxID=1658519 RepID=UPI003D283909